MSDQPGTAAALVIEARGLRKAYRSGAAEVPVLRGVDLAVPSGAFVVLLGPSGCGKTTLLNLIGGLDAPDSGELRVAGVDLRKPRRAVLSAFRRERVGFIFQFYNLLPTLTARENSELVLEGLAPAERAARVDEGLARVGLLALADRLPEQLSGGEQQRVAIARALLRRPPLVVADEPTGNLDRKSSRAVMALLRELNREAGMSFFLVSHDAEVAQQADLVLHMEDGVLL